MPLKARCVLSLLFLCFMPFQHMKGFIGTLFFQTVRRACICKLTYLQIFICKPQIQTCGALVVIHGHVQSVKKFFTCHTCSQLSLTRQHCLLASNAVNKCSFHGPFSFAFFCVCVCFLLVISLLQMTPMDNVEGLDSVLKHRKAGSTL